MTREEIREEPVLTPQQERDKTLWEMLVSFAVRYAQANGVDGDILLEPNNEILTQIKEYLHLE